MTSLTFPPSLDGANRQFAQFLTPFRPNGVMLCRWRPPSSIYVCKNAEIQFERRLDKSVSSVSLVPKASKGLIIYFVVLFTKKWTTVYMIPILRLFVTNLTSIDRYVEDTTLRPFPTFILLLVRYYFLRVNNQKMYTVINWPVYLFITKYI